jgi:hypothetical protein
MDGRHRLFGVEHQLVSAGQLDVHVRSVSVGNGKPEESVERDRSVKVVAHDFDHRGGKANVHDRTLERPTGDVMNESDTPQTFPRLKMSRSTPQSGDRS